VEETGGFVGVSWACKSQMGVAQKKRTKAKIGEGLKLWVGVDPFMKERARINAILACEVRKQRGLAALLPASPRSLFGVCVFVSLLESQPRL